MTIWIREYERLETGASLFHLISGRKRSRGYPQMLRPARAHHIPPRELSRGVPAAQARQLSPPRELPG